jgi:hypothetical protein
MRLAQAPNYYLKNQMLSVTPDVAAIHNAALASATLIVKDCPDGMSHPTVAVGAVPSRRKRAPIGVAAAAGSACTSTVFAPSATAVATAVAKLIDVAMACPYRAETKAPGPSNLKPSV